MKRYAELAGNRKKQRIKSLYDNNLGLVEECVGVDGDMLQQVIIPTMNVSRVCADGTIHEEEVLNKNQTYVSNSGTIEKSIVINSSNCGEASSQVIRSQGRKARFNDYPRGEQAQASRSGEHLSAQAYGEDIVYSVRRRTAAKAQLEQRTNQNIKEQQRDSNQRSRIKNTYKLQSRWR